MEQLSVIITGATGMVGEGVLHECLQHSSVKKVLVVGRRSCGVSHDKLSEVLVTNFMELSSVAPMMQGYDACFFCLGTTSIGKKEAEYHKATYDLTMNFAETLSKLNPQMTFCYVSGSGTDSTEKGRLMWARVKGKTENNLMKLPFKAVYCFRPGYIQPIKGLKNAYRIHKYVSWMYPGLRRAFPKFMISLKEIGQAMINVTLKGYSSKIIETTDIAVLANA